MNIIEQIRKDRDMLNKDHKYERLIGNFSDRIAELESCLRDMHQLLDTSGVPKIYSLERIEGVIKL